MSPGDLSSLHGLIDDCLVADRFRLHKRLRSMERSERGGADALSDLTASIRRSRAVVAQRAGSVPEVSYPPELPISERADEIAALIREHPVVVVCGETGSGKSTQLPKICLAAERGIAGMIAHTQPRRLAARTISARLSEEMNSPLGEAVGYRVRFSEKVSAGNYIRVLTDGMLLAECESDRFLTRYDTIIIDEAHERGLNIDFLLGYLHRLLEKRPELKLVITSATLDSDKFSRHFGGAPVISVSGRTWPVEVRYRPLEDAGTRSDEKNDDGILHGIQELLGHGPGDVLVFLPGEREIREAADYLGKRLKSGIELLPLYARLSPKEQQRIFHPGGRTRVILATNVAETSLTIPGVRYVIDTGFARISRYSPGRRVQRLPVERVSRAAAEQRKGRCGRVASGICIRLYGEEDFEQRSEYTDPEILRTSLAEVVLRMKALRLGEAEAFPFIDPPPSAQIRAGVRELDELGALTARGGLSRIGRRLARLPLDPRIGRMLLAAEQEGCLEEMTVLAAVLSIPDPRLTPHEQLAAARRHHRELGEAKSDFMALLELWNRYAAQRKALSRRKLKAWCEESFLSTFRMREWVDLKSRLQRQLAASKVRRNEAPATADLIHRALLAGLLGNVALHRGDGEYLGAHGKKLWIFPGSLLHGKHPKWIMAAELVETSRLYGRAVAPVSASWIEQAAGPLLRFEYSEPRWERRAGRVIANRRAALYGLTIFSGRKCDYEAVNPAEAREIFIRGALVAGECDLRAPFLDWNRKLLAEIEALENKARRRDILVDEEVLFDFYQQRVPADVGNAAALEKWLRGQDDPRLLCMERAALMRRDGGEITPALYPDRLQLDGGHLSLEYRFQPGEEGDGIAARIRLPLLNQVSATVLQRLVPGFLLEKVVLLIKSLPKTKRRRFVPAPDAARALLSRIEEDRRSLPVALAEAMTQYGGIEIAPSELDEAALPSHLRMNLELLDDTGGVIDRGQDLEALQQRHGEQARRHFATMGKVEIERSGIRAWDFGELPETVEIPLEGRGATAWPALVDEGESVAIKVFDTADAARQSHRKGLLRLLLLGLPAQQRLLRKPPPGWGRLGLLYAGIGDSDGLRRDLVRAVNEGAFFATDDRIRDRETFLRRQREGAQRLPGLLAELAELTEKILKRYREVCGDMLQIEAGADAELQEDLEQQLAHLVYPGFVASTSVEWLRQLPRFLQGIALRLERWRHNPDADHRRRLELQRFVGRWLQHAEEADPGEALQRYRWMVEEYRISLFAQELRTSIPVSPKRLERQWG
ncbi:MAG: ATP-dependent RNA helicase HrpA, partial [Pseudomonadota bacterium]|nr:ATP-dependent RNA helicase HrpA [Pseudomonadota bacterium]